MPKKSWKDQSKLDWCTNAQDDESIGREAIQIGCLMRIADATELMAASHQDLISERDRYKLLLEQERAWRCSLERSNTALRGVITKLKKLREPA